MAIATSILTLALVTAPCFAADLENAWHVIRPIIHPTHEQKAAAMRSAPIAVLAEIQAIELCEKPREVEKPSEVGGPMIPVIPLHLARITAKSLLAIRGIKAAQVEFYSWIWASGKHGGTRLFHAEPKSVHVLFLALDSGHLHTVGDYPAYDVEVRLRAVQSFMTNWEAGYLQGADSLERVVAVLLKAELESVDETEAAKYWLNSWEFATLTSREFVATQLKNLCTTLTNPGGRAKACAEHAQLVRE